MTRVVPANFENLKTKIMTNAKEATIFFVKDSKIKGLCDYGFTKNSTAESRACAVRKLEKALTLPKDSGEIFAVIV